MSKTITAHIEHTSDTIHTLSRVQHRSFMWPGRFLSAAVGIGAVIYGVMSGMSSAWSLILMFFGCWVVISLDMPAKRTADKLIASAKTLPKTEYCFTDSAIEMKVDGKADDLSYGKIYSILEDGENIYMFISRLAGYVVPKSSVSGGSADELLRLLEKKTGLEAEQTGAFVMKGIRGIETHIRNERRRSGTYYNRL